MFSVNPKFSHSSFTLIKKLFSSSSLSAIEVVSSTYLRLLIFLPAILIPCNTKDTAKSLQSCLTLCDPIDGSHQAPPSLGFSRQEHWSGLPFPSPMHESEKWKWKWSRVWLSNPMDCSLPGSSIHEIFQARVLEWVPLPSPMHESEKWKWSCSVVSDS